MQSHRFVRDRYARFWESRKHALVPPIPLVPQNDPTTLFTGSGMQQLVPYLLGEPHPLGKRVYNIQPCIRSQDIEEVGDNRHTTFFEMMGNWSLGDYFKKDQLEWVFTFLTDTKTGLGLDPARLYVSVFSGADGLEADTESIGHWQRLFQSQGIQAEFQEMGSEEDAAGKGMGSARIFSYDAKKNWWSRAGVPSAMPPGEPGGPDSEVFYEFTAIPHDPKYGLHCHPNCDCGRFMEIGNSVFMQYKKADDGSFVPLVNQNVDFGGGLERQLSALCDNPDVFTTDLFTPVIHKLEELSNTSYSSVELKRAYRIITDHLKGAVMLIHTGVTPSNKEQGYVVRRMLRRAIWMGRQYLHISEIFTPEIVDPVLTIYEGVIPDLNNSRDLIKESLELEESRFVANLEKGRKEVPRLATRHALSSVKAESQDGDAEVEQHLDRTATGELLFYLYESYGFPPDLTTEMLTQEGWTFSKEYMQEFAAAKKAHQDSSRAGSAGKFKGGLADNSQRTIQYHTATHLLHQALFSVLGESVRQEGSNITGERLRFDFSCARKPSEQEISQIESVINQKISDGLPVVFKMLPKEDALKIGAKSFFREKYPDTVKVYMIGGEAGKEESTAYSMEFCGGPHVTSTAEIGPVKIQKLEKIGTDKYRVYLV